METGLSEMPGRLGGLEPSPHGANCDDWGRDEKKRGWFWIGDVGIYAPKILWILEPTMTHTKNDIYAYQKTVRHPRNVVK